MNERIATILVDRLQPLKQRALITTLTGLVKTESSDAFDDRSADTQKQMESFPVPVSAGGNLATNYKLLLPDPAKASIVFFEDGGCQQRNLGGFSQYKCRLTLICWYNGSRIQNLTRDKLTNVLLTAIVGQGRTIPVPITEPGLSKLQFSGYQQVLTDPFTKYTAYNKLFNFRNSPYGWLAMDLSLTVYDNVSCIG